MKKMPKTPQRSLIQKMGLGLKIGVALELVGLAASYMVWRKMNKDQEFRYKIYETSPVVLDYFYQVGEKLGGVSTREEDYKAWGLQLEKK